MIDLSTVAGFLPAFARAAGFAFTAPLIGEATTPTRARLLFAVAVASAVTVATPGDDPADAFVRVPLELGAGALAGVCARLVLDRVAAGGQLIGLFLGLGFASDYDPRAGESASAARRLIGALAGLAFLAAGGLEAGVRAVAPGATQVDLAGGLAGFVTLATTLMAHALGFAAPVLIAAIVLNLGLAFVNRAAPAVNVFSVSLPAVLLGGGMVLYATTPAVAAAIDGTARAAAALLEHWGRA